ncbi:AAA family ATPase [Polyangium spumosum]|uniref:AAA family ATPase n=1 Tax=Polyangium spumosum TaxID=889282 RepID=A0A6N7PZN1_9BACT|nr:AAA family ATPase [Polyangium spumosum]MRG97319.1 AAA family ATPase [Polyangium spumosum]
MFLRSLKLNRLLSFGPDAEAVELRPLNVLIGPNGSGKSNFIEAISLLKAAPKDLAVPIREGGGTAEWLWKGNSTGHAAVEAVTNVWIRHQFAFIAVNHRLHLTNERIADIGEDGTADVPYFNFANSREATLYGNRDESVIINFDREQSVLSQVKGPNYPGLGMLAEYYEDIRLYRDFTFGRRSPARRPQPADLPTDHLMENAENLGLILNKFRRDIPTKKALIEGLKKVFDGITDFSVQVEANTAQIFLEEEGWTIPATRVSDGTMRWLSLLAILLDPNPPALVCIEEPELGLHPDLMNPLARLLKDASERMQIIITTHSEALVGAFTETPEDVLVCERRDGSTTMQRLDREQLSEWLEEYSLGQLWSKGILGGNRW